MQKVSVSVMLLCSSWLYGETLDAIEVGGAVSGEEVTEVAKEEVKSADLAEALRKQSASVHIVRRSGIANDLIIRGARKDNLNITIDNAKIYGACPNRMDPPISHVLSNNVDSVSLIKGPYNVEDFGVLSADVKVKTKDPEAGYGGELFGNIGSFGYRKWGTRLHAGSDALRFLLSLSDEKGDAYKDGNGRNLFEQVDDYVASHLNGKKKHDMMLKARRYLPKYRNDKAFSKKTAMGKLYWQINDNTLLKLGYTTNRSKHILYPNTPMDAPYDNSDIYTIDLSAKDLGRFSKSFDLSLYKSKVDHPMSQRYRYASKMKGVVRHWLQSDTVGAKIKNSVVLAGTDLTLGLDYSKRNWDGGFFKEVGGAFKRIPKAAHSIWDVNTINKAFFIEDSATLGKWKLKSGLRYDATRIDTARSDVKTRHFRSIGGYLRADYKLNDALTLLSGVGVASRVPDGKELFYVKQGKAIGNPTLNAILNKEIDIGVDYKSDHLSLKSSLFYCRLQDDILYNATQGRYENVDATLWGFDVDASYILNDSFFIDAGAAYQRGKKSRALFGQSDTDLPDTPPLKLTLALNWMPNEALKLKLEAIHSAAWSRFDSDNGEQYLPAYTVANFKADYDVNRHLSLTFGVDNLFDKTYAVSNTYKDLTLTSGGGDVMLLNEPGRSYYLNASYRF